MVKSEQNLRYTRIILFVFNLLLLLFGFCLIGLGVYIKSSDSFDVISQLYSVSDALRGEAMQWIGIGMIIAGILTSFLAVFTCLGI